MALDGPINIKDLQAENPNLSKMDGLMIPWFINIASANNPELRAKIEANKAAGVPSFGQAQQPQQQPYQPQPFDHSQLFQQQNGLLGQNQFSRPQGNSQFGHQQGNSQFGQGQNQFGRQQVDLEQLKRGR